MDGPKFEWQEGFGAFSESDSRREDVIAPGSPTSAGVAVVGVDACRASGARLIAECPVRVIRGVRAIRVVFWFCRWCRLPTAKCGLPIAIFRSAANLRPACHSWRTIGRVGLSRIFLNRCGRTHFSNGHSRFFRKEQQTPVLYCD